ncbi:hypothetical protein IWGMT90018_61430 [Mycobacterium kiyosense]|nr:hypothetical protein IWGMT90018_61430 [Mycobacterium kiyosense]
MTEYAPESVDRLPFSTPDKSQRYRTENYSGATGLNWYLSDPTLQFTMAYYLQPDELAVAEPHLADIGALMGGPVTRWADETDRNPPRLERYDRWGHDVSRVVLPESFIQSKRAVLDAQQTLRTAMRDAGFRSTLALFAANYLLDEADIGMACALGTGGGMVQSLVAAYAPPDVREHVLAKFESGGVGGRDRPAAHRAHRRLGSGCAGDDGHAQRRLVAAQRLQVVRLQLRRRGVRGVGQTRRRPRIPAGASPTSWCCGLAGTAPATGCGCAGSRTNLAPARWRRARWSSPTPKPSCCPRSPRRTRARPTARAWAG